MPLKAGEEVAAITELEDEVQQDIGCEVES